MDGFRASVVSQELNGWASKVAGVQGVWSYEGPNQWRGVRLRRILLFRVYTWVHVLLFTCGFL